MAARVTKIRLILVAKYLWFFTIPIFVTITNPKSKLFLHFRNIKELIDSKIITYFVQCFSNEKSIINESVRSNWFVIDLYTLCTTSMEYLVSFEVVFTDTSNLVGLIVQTISALDILQWCALFLYIVYVCS